MKKWIDEIVEQCFTNYQNRKIVLWGYYQSAFDIRDALKEKYNLMIDRFVDGNRDIIDYRMIYPPDSLKDRSKEFYVIIPLAYNQAVSSLVREWGYGQNDFFYFNDCVLEYNDEIYLDSHGNKVIRPPHNVKFVFKGYNNYIEFSKEYSFYSKVTITVESDNKICIEGDGNFRNTNFYLCSGNSLKIKQGSELLDMQMTLCEKNNVVIEKHNKISSSNWYLETENKILFKNNIKYQGNIKMIYRAEMYIGEDSVVGSQITLYDYGKLSFGKKVFFSSIREDYIAFHQDSIFLIPAHGVVDIGDECLASIGVKIICGDGHSVFDVDSGKNLNSGEDACNKIVLEKHVWIGEDVTLLQGTHIGKDSIIGTRSLVNKTYPANCIIAGMPAKIRKTNRTWNWNWGIEEIPE